MPYQNSFTTIKQKLFQKNWSSALQQSIKWIKIDSFIHEGEVIFKKNSRVGLLEVSRLIDSGKSKRQRDQWKQSFLLFPLYRKNYCIKEKMDLLWTPRNITSLDGLCYEAINSSISQNIFSYLDMFNMVAEKTLQLKITKKEWI